MSNEISMAESYDDFPRIEEAFQRRLDERLNPTGPASLLDPLAETLRAAPAEEIVDVGCGEGEEAIEIARGHGAFHSVRRVYYHTADRPRQ